MTFARPAGTVPAGSIALDGRVKRAAAFGAAGVLAALNAQADQIIGAFQHQHFFNVIGRLAGISAVIWVAMYAAIKVGFEDDREAVGGRDAVVLAAVVALSAIPLSFTPRAGLLICALYLLATTAPRDAGRRVCLILLALTGPLIWGRILLHVFAAPILSLDAHVVGALVGSGVDGNVVGFADGRTNFIIGGPCSSVHNISLAIVLWATAGAMFKVRIDRGYVAFGAAMVAWMFTLNIARLACIGFFPRHFTFLHSGDGAILFGWAALIGAGLLAGWGVIRAVDRQR